MQTERQKEIVEVALEIITKKGIQGLTIKNLAKKNWYFRAGNLQAL
ncbi:MAG: hypothetical protein IMY71_04630 [Bacteroidetes bacterium]|nr:hypothetical protein [Bacteroidota bacterium]